MSETLIQIIDALGWTLLHSLWQGGLLALVLWLALTLMRDTSAATRYMMASGALLIFAVIPPITFLLIYQAPAVATAVTMAGLEVGAAVELMPAASAVMVSADPASFLASLERFLPAMVLVWTIGVFLRAARVATAWRRATAYLADGASLPSPDLVARFEAMVVQITPTLRPMLMISDRVSVPAVVGWLKPVVLLPTSVLSGLSPVQLDLIIAHELAHVRRHDYLINLMQIVVETLLFYHPAVHWVSRLMRNLREECCDEIVVESRGERVAYARALAELEGLRQHDGAICMAATGGQLFDRISRIALPHQHRGSAPWSTGIIITASAAIVVSTVGQLSDHVMQNNVDSRPGSVQVTEHYAPMTTLTAVPRADIAPLVLPSSEAPIIRTASIGPQVETTERPMLPAPLALDLSAMASEIASSAPPALASSNQETERLNLASQGPVVSGGTPLTRTAPEFPRRMEREGRGAVIQFQFMVQEDGSVTNISFLGALPQDDQFRAAVIDAVDEWRFEPFTIDGRPVSQQVQDSVVFEVAAADVSSGCNRVTGSRVCRRGRTRNQDFGVAVVYQGSN